MSQPISKISSEIIENGIREIQTQREFILNSKTNPFDYFILYLLYKTQLSLAELYVQLVIAYLECTFNFTRESENEAELILLESVPSYKNAEDDLMFQLIGEFYMVKILTQKLMGKKKLYPALKEVYKIFERRTLFRFMYKNGANEYEFYFVLHMLSEYLSGRNKIQLNEIICHFPLSTIAKIMHQIETKTSFLSEHELFSFEASEGGWYFVVLQPRLLELAIQ
jgi:hypothetical protein